MPNKSKRRRLSIEPTPLFVLSFIHRPSSILQQKVLPYILMYNPLAAHIKHIHGAHIFWSGGRILVRYTLKTVFMYYFYQV